MMMLLPHTNYGLVIIYISLTVFFAAHATATAIQSDNNGTSEESVNDVSENLVNIMLSDHDPIDFFISTDGSLAHFDLDQPTNISTAIALSSVSATCFFWRDREGFTGFRLNGFISEIFSSMRQRSRGYREIYMPWNEFDGAERVYCYDASRENVLGDSFTLFFDIGGVRREEVVRKAEGGGGGEEEEELEAPDREGKLLRLSIGKDEEFVEFPLYTNPDPSYAELGIGSRIKLITKPLWYQHPPFGEEGDGMMLERPFAGCYLIKPDFEQAPDFRLTNTILEAFLDPTDVIDSIVCFNDAQNPQARDRWLREKFEGRSALLEDSQWHTAMKESYNRVNGIGNSTF